MPRSLLAVLLAAALAGLAATQWGRLRGLRDTAVSGEVHVMAVDFEDGRTKLEYHLLSTSTAGPLGPMVHLYKLEGPLVAQLRTGQLVSVAGRQIVVSNRGSMNYVGSAQAGHERVLQVSSLTVVKDAEHGRPTSQPAVLTAAASQAAAASDPAGPEDATLAVDLPVAQPSISTLVLPLSFEGCPAPAGGRYARPWWLRVDVEAVFFENASPDNTWTTVGGRFRSCSHGQSLLTRANSVVAPVLKIPCSGTTPRGTPYSTSDCTALDYRGFQEAGLEAAKAAGISVQLYKYISVLLPPGNTCNFIGTGNLGCPGSCGTWIQGTAVMGNARAAPRNTHHVLHEMGRNLYLGDAAGPGGSAADLSCAMGQCCSSRCYNAPHAWQLGWIAPKVLDGRSLGPGETRTVAVLGQTRSKESGLRIEPTWVQGGVPIYVSYRLAERGDKQLAPQFANRVIVHSFAGRTGTQALPTRQLGVLAGGGTLVNAPTGLTIRVVKADPATGAATVAVSRRANGVEEAQETRREAVDGGCNGLTGSADPDCWASEPRPAATA